MKCKKNKTEFECIDGELYYTEYDHSISSIFPFYREYVGRCKCYSDKIREYSDSLKSQEIIK